MRQLLLGGNPDYDQGCHFGRRQRIAHTISCRATIILGVAQTHPFIRGAKPATFSRQTPEIIASAAIAPPPSPQSRPTRLRDRRICLWRFTTSKTHYTIHLSRKHAVISFTGHDNALGHRHDALTNHCMREPPRLLPLAQPMF